MRPWHRLLAVTALAGCGSENVDDAFCVEEHVTISQGIYGRVTYQTDLSPRTNPPTPVANEPIAILDGPNGATVTTVTSNDLGVFQSALDVGVYALCFPSSPCVTFTIRIDQLVRADLHKGFGSAWVATQASSCANH